MAMRLPSRLKQVLQEDKGLYADVLASFALFEQWAGHSKTPFFPEYTDHGPQHVQRVLETADWLVSEAARPLLSAGDVATLSLAVILHDCALHLTEDGFQSLVASAQGRGPIQGFGDRPWPDLWENFIAEATRLDTRKLIALFGDPLPAHRPKPSPSEWTLRDRLLIGEFIRRNHGRLAHESALYGIPGMGDDTLRILDRADDYADLSGVVARSHTLPLRPCIDYMCSKYGHEQTPEYNGVHALFLMCLLRVADYLQIFDPRRAPRVVLQTWRIRSLASQREWNAHLAVCSASRIARDPEAIRVQANPADVVTYLKVKQWLRGIQNELDQVWAVLGEEYGRYEELRNLGIKLRRVRSNLDDEQAFARQVDYIPFRALIQSAGADLLELLIEPLYGNRPEFGVRELVQNAVDAVREMRVVQSERANLEDIDFPELAADVVISLDEEAGREWWLTVEDRGVGMTARTIRDYFLTVGACFRKSDEWRRDFVDESGASRVLRSGRFGIGILAAFLLGRTVHVTSRHFTSEEGEGLSFAATVDTELVEVRRMRRPVGTTVRIKLDDRVARLLTADPRKWDWYCLTSPSLVRRIRRAKKRVGQKYELPGAGEPLAHNVRRIAHADFADVQWTHSEAPLLACNGLVVRDREERQAPLIRNILPDMDIEKPGISVFDPDGKLPLTLDRTDIADPDYPLERDVAEDVAHDFMAHAIVNAPQAPMQNWSPLLAYFSCRYAGAVVRRTGSPRWAYWFSTSDGTYFADDWLIHNLAIRRALVFLTYTPYSITPTFSMEEPCPLFSLALAPNRAVPEWLRSVWHGKRPEVGLGFPCPLHVTGWRLVMQASADRYMREIHAPRAEMWPKRFGADLTMYQVGPCPNNASIDATSLQSRLRIARDLDWPGVIVELYFASAQAKVKSSFLGRMWYELIGPQPIPYSLAERRARLGSTLDLLKTHVSAHVAAAEAHGLDASCLL